MNLTPSQEADLEKQRIEFNLALRDSAEDSGMEEDVIYGDILEAMVWQIEDLAVARELCRRELGYIPVGLERRLGKADWLR